MSCVDWNVLKTSADFPLCLCVLLQSSAPSSLGTGYFVSASPPSHVCSRVFLTQNALHKEHGHRDIPPTPLCPTPQCTLLIPSSTSALEVTLPAWCFLGLVRCHINYYVNFNVTSFTQLQQIKRAVVSPAL